jgi:hypothetical protein
MPNLGITEPEARALVAYLKWMAAVDTNGFPPNFNRRGNLTHRGFVRVQKSRREQCLTRVREARFDADARRRLKFDAVAEQKHDREIVADCQLAAMKNRWVFRVGRQEDTMEAYCIDRF